MTPEQYQKAVEIEREFQVIGKDKIHLKELSNNLFLQAEAYGCGQHGKDVAETTAESIHIYLDLHPERIMEVCEVLMKWAGAEAAKIDKQVAELKKRVETL